MLSKKFFSLKAHKIVISYTMIMVYVVGKT